MVEMGGGDEVCLRLGGLEWGGAMGAMEINCRGVICHIHPSTRFNENVKLTRLPQALLRLGVGFDEAVVK